VGGKPPTQLFKSTSLPHLINTNFPFLSSSPTLQKGGDKRDINKDESLFEIINAYPEVVEDFKTKELKPD
jgi:hypothetical protein